jgi:hypothetical protein
MTRSTGRDTLDFSPIDLGNVYLFGGNQLDEIRELVYPVERVLAYCCP